MRYIIGLDIGGTKCAVILAKVSRGIKKIDKLKFATKSEEGFLQTKDNLFKAINKILKRNDLKNVDIDAVGISCGGPLDSKKGVVLSPPNLPSWDNIPITDMIEEEFGIKAYLQNDANACALVEWKLGAAKGTNNMIFLTMGTGMGAGIVAEGKVIEGRNSMGGEVGHIRLDKNGPMGFGKKGSFEGFCSGAGIGKQAVSKTKELEEKGILPQWIKDGYTYKDIDAKLISIYADKGDEYAISIYKETGKRLGQGVSILIDILNPECIVIGSIFERSENLLRKSMEEEIEKEALIYSRKDLKIVGAQTGDEIGDYASIMVACYKLGINVEEKKEEKNGEVLEIFNDLFRRYNDLKPIKQSIMNAYLLIYETYKDNGKILTCGNGGSASDADHIVGELMKSFAKKRNLNKDLENRLMRVFNKYGSENVKKFESPLRAISLTEHTALSSAYANDVKADMGYAQKLLGYGDQIDTLIAISTSGNSKNIINATLTAKALGMKTIALTGKGGGVLKNISDVVINAPGNTTYEIQERHLPIYHTLCLMIEEKMLKEK